MDVFGDVPWSLVGRFDVVHIRTFCIVVKNGNPVPLLRNLIEMLSEFMTCLPSSRIVLVLHRANASSILKNRADTSNGTRWTVPPSARIRQTSTPRKRTRTNYYACGSDSPPIPITSSGTRNPLHGTAVSADSSRPRSWLSNLDAIFGKNGLDVVDPFRLPISDELRKASTDNFVMALEGIGALTAGKNSALLGTHEEFRMLFGKAVRETQDGVTISMDMVVAVGRKPVAE